MKSTPLVPEADYRCGLVALAGRPNVGKSSLLNALLGVRLSIVTHRPQTTRHRILGVATRKEGQILYVDTPGLQRHGKKAISEGLNRAARGALREVDLIMHVVKAGRWDPEEEALYEELKAQSVPRILVLNKIDLIRHKHDLLPFTATLQEAHTYNAVHYVSALKKKGLDLLERDILNHLPLRPPVYEEEEITDRSERFLAAERVQEQLMLRLGQELPYATTVEIEHFADRPGGGCEIHAVIWVERETQKAIVIGRGGEQLKAIGTAARKTIAHLLDRKVHLRLWVKVRAGWTDDKVMLKKFGYLD